MQFHKMTRIVYHEILHFHTIPAPQTHMALLIQLPWLFVDVKIGRVNIGWK
jgi:hypothetical protein